MRKIARGTATLVGVIFGVLSALFASGGGHGPICEAVLAGSPLTVFVPDYMLVPGSILFWGCLGFFWHRVVICRYLVAVHLSFAVAALPSCPIIETGRAYWTPLPNTNTKPLVFSLHMFLFGL